MATLKQHRAAGARGETSALNGATPAELLARLDGHAKPGTPAARGQGNAGRLPPEAPHGSRLRSETTLSEVLMPLGLAWSNLHKNWRV